MKEFFDSGYLLYGLNCIPSKDVEILIPGPDTCDFIWKLHLIKLRPGAWPQIQYVCVVIKRKNLDTETQGQCNVKPGVLLTQAKEHQAFG